MTPTRRSVLAALGATAGWATVHTLGCDESRSRGTPPTLMPAVFVSHGAPTVALDAHKGAPFRALSAALPRPRAVLAVSAHWEAAPTSVGTTTARDLLYDFSGFPEELYRVQYRAPAAAELTDRVLELLGGDVASAPERPWDHGVWTPLVHMFPEADVPLLQLSLPSKLGPEGVFALGRALAPLRAEGVLLFGSGGATHNLRLLRADGTPPEGFAIDFDAWAKETLAARDFDALLAARERAPRFSTNHPSVEHWLPLVFSAGTSADRSDAVSFPIEGFEHGSLSRRAVRFG